MSWKQASKYRHAVAKPAKRELWYTDYAIAPELPDASHGIAASESLFAVPSATLGSVLVGRLDRPGKAAANHQRTIAGHAGAVTDLQFAPFAEGLLATCGEDATVKLWAMNATAAGAADDENDGTSNNNNSNANANAQATLKAASNRVEGVRFHPVADQVLASIGQSTVSVWDIEKEQERLACSFGSDMVSLSWKGDGTVIATTNKDRKLRVVDPRSSSVAMECEPHNGVKSSVVIWLGNMDKLFTTGFSKSRDREYSLWDSRNLGSPLGRNSIDTSTGILLPLFDEDTNMLFIGGKGDGTVRWFELVPDKSPYFQWEGAASVTNEQQRGLTLVPKRGLDVMACEVNRILKVGQKDIMPLQFNVARKTYSIFHDDLFPETKSDSPGQNADAWFGGENAVVSLSTLDPKRRPARRAVPSSSPAPASAAASPAPNAATPDNSSQKSSNNSTPQVTPSPAPVAESASPSPAVGKNDAEVQEVEIITKELNIVRKTKYNYLAGKTLHPSNNYDHLNDLSVKMPGESDVLESSSEIIIVPLSKPGGQVGIISVGNKGRQANKLPAVVNGAELLDLAMDPFNSRSFATACDDGHVRVWNIPKDFSEDISQCSMDLKGHLHRVNLIRYHPLAANVLISSSPELSEPSVRYWDLITGKEMIKLTGFEDMVFDVGHNYDGSKVAVVSKDKKLRIFDPRSQTLLQEGASHEGARGARVVWLGKTGFLCTIGFDKSSGREIKLYDSNDLSKCLATHMIDISPAILVPYFDEDVNVLFLWGRGDPSTHFVEVTLEAPYLHYLTKFDAGSLQLGQSFFPKSSVDVTKVEIAKSYRLCQSHIEMITYTVPRAKMDYFQDDIYVPTRDFSKPVLTSEEWFGGVTREAPLLSLQPEGMKPLSEAPVEKKVRKYESRQVGVLSEEEKKKQVIDNMFKNVRDEASEAPLWQDQQQGVEDSEWDDY